jgi:hypothetical protein
MSPKLAVIALAFACIASPAPAHDICARLKNGSGFLCCDGQDCRPATYRSTPRGVEMFVYGGWLPIPDYTIQYRSLEGDTGETKGGHWCGREVGYGSPAVTYCAVLPPKSAAASRP